MFKINYLIASRIPPGLERKIDDKIEVWMDLGGLLDALLVDFGIKLGGKLGQVGIKMVPKFGSVHLVGHKSGQEAILDRDAHCDADSRGRLGGQVEAKKH